MDHPGDDAEPRSFTRDGVTSLTFGMAVAFGFGVAAIGPAMPLLREDLAINRTIGGLHFTALAAGSVVMGFVVARLIVSLGRSRVFWLGGAGIAAGALVIGVGWHPVITLVGGVLLGGSGTAMAAVSQAALSDIHGSNRAVALTGVNTSMSVGTALPALVIGALVAAGAGWRPAFVTPLAIVVVLASRRRSERFPAHAPQPAAASARPLPGAYWFFWAAFIPAVGAEWSVGAWGAGYLVDITGTSEGVASFLMTAFFGAMLAGRFVGGRIARRVEPFPLLLGATALGLAGVLLFWASETAAPVVAGLLVAGLGISMLYPMIVSLTIGTAPDRSDVASARGFIAAGGAVLVAPLTLGAMADQIGLRSAFAVVPAAFIVLVLLATLGIRTASAARTLVAEGVSRDAGTERS